MKYLTRTKSKIFKIRIRVSAHLRPFFKKIEINKSLHTKDYRRAIALSRGIIQEYLMIQESYALGLYSSETMLDVANSFSNKLGLTIIPKLRETPTGLKSHKECFDEFKKYYKALDITEEKKDMLLNFLNNVYLTLVNPKTPIASIDLAKMLQVKEQLEQLPKRNIQKYKQYTVKQLLKLNIEESERVSTRTIREYFSYYIKRFYNYCKAQRYIEVNPTDFITIKSESSQDTEREPFTKDEVKQLLKLIDKEDENKRVIYYCLIYSGLRSSELWKASLKLDKVTGIWFFDLTDKRLKLKTLSSHRVIPLHSELIKLDVPNSLSKSLQSCSQDHMQKRFNSMIKSKVTNSNKKVLYSFRHTVATQLKYAEVNPLVISELLGHSTGKGMTMGRYASRYPLEVLKEAIETLSFTSSNNQINKLK